jgi:hypothetical protein
MGNIIGIIFAIMMQQELLLMHLACSFAFYTMFQLAISLSTVKILTGHQGQYLVPLVPEQTRLWAFPECAQALLAPHLPLVPTPGAASIPSLWQEQNNHKSIT